MGHGKLPHFSYYRDLQDYKTVQCKSRSIQKVNLVKFKINDVFRVTI